MEKQLYHVVEFYRDPDGYAAQMYRGTYSTIPKNISFLAHIRDQIVIKAYPVEIDKEISFVVGFKDKDKCQVIVTSPAYNPEDYL